MAATAPAQVRPRREREEELLVWPDLVFVEFICAALFTATFTVMSALVNAPLINRANADVTPNPSKAPWYFLNLQELLLHMHPALAGVIVPTVALILLAAIPYLDRSKEGQGVWFGTLNSVRISVVSGIFATAGTLLLILLDSGKHADWYEQKWSLWLPLWGLLALQAAVVLTAGLVWFVSWWRRSRQGPPRRAEQYGALGFVLGIVLFVVSAPTVAVAGSQWGDETLKPELTWPSGSARPDWLPDSGFVFATWDLGFSRDFRSIQTGWE